MLLLELKRIVLTDRRPLPDILSVVFPRLPNLTTAIFILQTLVTVTVDDVFPVWIRVDTPTFPLDVFAPVVLEILI